MISLKKYSYLAVAGVFAGVLVVASCGVKEKDPYPTIEYVENILSDKESSEYKLLSSQEKASPKGEICIIGGSNICNLLSESLYTYDKHDNVDGRFSSDGLPDFAGEAFSLIADETPYSAYIKNNDVSELRRQTVMRVLCAVDTLTHISQYDLEGTGGKLPSKVIVLADPYLSQNGMHDVERLFLGTGCGIPVISPLGNTLDSLFSHSAAKISIGLIFNPATAPASVYAQYFGTLSGKYPGGERECYLFPSDRKDSLLHRFMSSYSDTRDVPLDAIVVADPAVDVEGLKTELADVVSVMNAASLKYGKILSSSFRIDSVFDDFAETLYDMFRRRNLFTHNISFPAFVYYNPVTTAGVEDGKIILTNGLDVQN